MINGLIYIENFISLDEQNFLIESIDKYPWDSSLKRRTQHYGYKYDYTKKNIDKSSYVGAVPDIFKIYCESLTKNEWFANAPDQIIINEYLPGQGISKHVDCIPCFDKTIASLSLNTSCIMQFEQWGQNEKKFLLLKPLSLLILTGDARYRWMHSIPACTEDVWNEEVLPRGRRISLTFRKIIMS